MSSLISPAALVAGASLASFFELRDRLAVEEGDSHRVRVGKSLTVLLLLGAFASEIACVYVNVVTGDQIMANGDAPVSLDAFDDLPGGWGRGLGHKSCSALSPMGFMHREMEFEYLASRVGFFQGILMWLGALSIELAVSADLVKVPRYPLHASGTKP